MSLFTITAPITITCHKRLSVYLEQEVLALGFTVAERFITGVRLQGTLQDCIRLNLNLRCASQVLFSLDRFGAAHPDDIYENLLEIAWEDLLPEDVYFSVTSNVLHETINNNMFASLRVKDAIVDRLRRVRGARPETGAALKGAVIHLFWKGDEAEVFLDTSGESLGRHGYRKIPGKAPMLEALAAATVLATGWDGKAPFINPMCGSGTLAIEAALIATHAVPGLFRMNYGFMHLQDYDEAAYLAERGRLEQQIAEVPELKIIATDISEAAVNNARKNARAAGVEGLITFAVCDFADTPVPEGGGVMMVNPEYGARLGDLSALEHTYARIGDYMKSRCQGYRGYVFTGNMELAKKIGLKARRRMEFYNATIDCRLLEYELYKGSREAR